jgi:hypothetical protein
MLRLIPLLSVLILIAPASLAQSYDAAFITRLGDDTLAVERFARTPGGMEAEVVLRTPQTTVTRYRLDLDDAGALKYFEAVASAPGAPSDAPPLRREVVTPASDGLEVSHTTGGETTSRSIQGDAGMLPFIDMVHWPFELMLVRAHVSGQDSVAQGLFTGRGSFSFAVASQGDGAMTVTHPYRGTMDVRVDREGRLLALDAGATTRKLIVTRVADVDIEGLAGRFAARDAAGQPFGPLSGRGETAATVHGAGITIDYGTPVARGREIFGALVPWGEVWRTGANLATHFETDRALQFGDLALPAGTYTFYTIPDPAGGTLIISSQTGQGGAGYNPDRDLGRVPMSIGALDNPVEVFTIRVDEEPSGGLLRIQWDRTEFTVPFSVE